MGEPVELAEPRDYRRERAAGRGDSAIGNVTESFAPPWMTREGAVQGGPGTVAGVTVKKKSPPGGLPRGGRESSGDLLSRARGPGTIGDLRLDFRVRDGNGYDPHSITAETISCMELNSLSNRQ